MFRNNILDVIRYYIEGHRLIMPFMLCHFIIFTIILTLPNYVSLIFLSIIPAYNNKCIYMSIKIKILIPAVIDGPQSVKTSS